MASLTIEEVKRVSLLERHDGCGELLTFLGWDPIDEEVDLGKTILLDYLYDHIVFAAQRGFPWDQVCCVFELAYSLHEQSVGKTLTESVTLFTELCKECQGRISTENLKKYTEFVFTTFMRHHKLYQFVFSRERDVLRIQHSVLVETSPTPPPFTEARGVKVWEYEQKLAKVESQAQQLKQEVEQAKQEATLKYGNQLKETYGRIQELAAPLSKEQIAEVIREVAEAHMMVASHSLKSNIQSTLTDLQVMLEKTCIPRPPELVPPSPPESQAGSEDEELDQLEELGAFGGAHQRHRGNIRASSRSSTRVGQRTSLRTGSSLGKSVQTGKNSAMGKGPRSLSRLATGGDQSRAPPRYQTKTPQLREKSAAKDKPARGSSRASRTGKSKQ